MLVERQAGEWGSRAASRIYYHANKLLERSAHLIELQQHTTGRILLHSSSYTAAMGQRNMLGAYENYFSTTGVLQHRTVAMRH